MIDKKLFILTLIIFFLGAIFLPWYLLLPFFFCSYYIISLLKWKVTIKDNLIISTHIFRKKKSFAFDYITTATIRKVIPPRRERFFPDVIVKFVDPIAFKALTQPTVLELYHETPDELFSANSKPLLSVISSDPLYNILISRLEEAKIPIKGSPDKNETWLT